MTEAQLITPAASTIKDKVDVIFPVADKLKTKTRNSALPGLLSESLSVDLSRAPSNSDGPILHSG